MQKVIVIGAGSRGQAYTNIMVKYPDDFKVVGVAEPIDSRRDYIKETHGISEENCFASWEPMLEKPRFADIAIISTMDKDHFAPAMAAIEKGYNLLLEKPMATTPEECVAITEAAKKKGVYVSVCFVLRYTPFFKTLKKMIQDGMVGDVASVQHIERVGHVHQSHSFVRGNWGNSDRSSFMLLQKSSHDMDILTWMLGKKCEKVQSFGSLKHFTPENAPKGAPERCIDGCPHADTCYYNAVKLYYDDKKNSWFRGAATGEVNPTDEQVEHALRTTNYGRCVYHCDNNVVDRQSVNMEYEGGIAVSFLMNAFNAGGRNIRIMGTKGEITGNMGEGFVSYYSFDDRPKGWQKIHFGDVLIDENITGGHGGGDEGIVLELRRLGNLGGDAVEECDIEGACNNHLLTFAAESARLNGQILDFQEYVKSFEK